jgi:serine/threonine protein phosphatase PrpC
VKLTQVAALTDPGRVRRRNEDAFVCEPPLFAVADGMGGAQAGEIASRLAAGAFREYHEADALSAEARLRSIIQEANRRIYARAVSDPHASGMGTTVTAALVSGSEVVVGHVGDSRCYLLRDGTLEQLTDDHSLVADLVRSGRLTPQEAEVHPQRSVITRALGTDAAVAVDSFAVEARPGDVFLLCSDGLTSMVDEDTVLRAVREQPTLEQAARALVEAANDAGGEDNITVVLFALDESGPDEDTLSGLEGLRLPAMPAEAPGLAGEDGSARDTTVAGRPLRSSRRERDRRGRGGRALLVAGGIVLLFAGVAAAALFGLSRAHFVGATDDGHVAVYQGVPWNFIAGTKLYREVYVSNLLAEQLSPDERRRLFDHDLMSEAAAKARIAPYEQQAEPPR